MSWNVANEVLYSKSPSVQQLASLQHFCDEHAEQLQKCYAPEQAALRPAITRFISRLFTLLESKPSVVPSTKSALYDFVERVSSHFARQTFFPSVFATAINESDPDLTELVYSSLFTEIIFTSELSLKWFAEVAKSKCLNDDNLFNPALTTAQQAHLGLLLLTSVQFIDVHQDWSAIRPPAKFLLKLHSLILETNNSTLRLIWMLAVHAMATQFVNSSNSDDLDVEPLLQHLQTEHGVHWSIALKDEISGTLNSVSLLVKAFELINFKNSDFPIIMRPTLAQTVAEVISSLLNVCNLNEELCRSLATCVSPYPALQLATWVPNDSLALLRAKCPASIFSLVLIAETLDLPARVAFLSEINSYVCQVETSSLLIDADAPVNTQLGASVETNCPITVLEPRLNDGQGALELDAKTTGTLLGVDGDEALVMWTFAYSGWSLIGRLWENADIKFGCDYDELTTEILKLVSTTTDLDVLAALSAGLARGDILDLVVNRLELWIHSKDPKYAEFVELAFQFLLNFVPVDSSRVWSIMYSLQWSQPEPRKQLDIVLQSVARILKALWPSFDPELDVHTTFINTVVQVFGWHYTSIDNFELETNVYTLYVFKILLPQNKVLQDAFLSPSVTQETYFAPLVRNLHNKHVLDFCAFLLQYAMEGKEIYTRNELCIDRKLFEASKSLANLFVENRLLRSQILKIWSILSLNTQSPPLLAFIGHTHAEKLKSTLVSIIKNKLESDERLATIAYFLTSARREEGLLDLLTDPIVSSLQSRVPSIEDKTSLATVLKVFVVIKSELKPVLISYLLEILSKDSTEKADLEVADAAVKVLANAYKWNVSKDSIRQFVIEENVHIIKSTMSVAQKADLLENWPHLNEYVNFDGETLCLADPLFASNEKWRKLRKEILTSMVLKKLTDAQLSLMTSWCDLVRLVSNDAKDSQKQKWTYELLTTNTEVSAPLSAHVGDTVSTETAAFLVINISQLVFTASDKNSSHSGLDILTNVLDQLYEVQNRPSFSLSQDPQRSTALLRLCTMIMAQLSTASIDIKLEFESGILFLLNNVIIPQSVYSLDIPETRLKLFLSLLIDSIAILKEIEASKLNSKDGKDKEGTNLVVAFPTASIFDAAVQTVTDSDTDYSLLKQFTVTSADTPVLGDLYLKHIFEWLQIDQAVEGFVRKGVLNALADAPLSHRIRRGNVVASNTQELHSVWLSILSILSRLVNVLQEQFAQDAYLFMLMYTQQVCTCFDEWRSGQVNMALIEETSLVFTLLTRLRAWTPAIVDLQEFNFDTVELSKNIELLLSHKKYSNARLSPNESEEVVLPALKGLEELVSSKRSF